MSLNGKARADGEGWCWWWCLHPSLSPLLWERERKIWYILNASGLGCGKEVKRTGAWSLFFPRPLYTHWPHWSKWGLSSHQWGRCGAGLSVLSSGRKNSDQSPEKWQGHRQGWNIRRPGAGLVPGPSLERSEIMWRWGGSWARVIGTVPQSQGPNEEWSDGYKPSRSLWQGQVETG